MIGQTALWKIDETPADAETYGLRLLDIAIKRYKPVAVYGMFSGGHDSLCATHIASRHPAFTSAIHINTGIGVEETRQFVRLTSAEMGWPLRELHALTEGQDYDTLVLEHGFPGPFGHRKMYNRLKERPDAGIIIHECPDCGWPRHLVHEGNSHYKIVHSLLPEEREAKSKEKVKGEITDLLTGWAARIEEREPPDRAFRCGFTEGVIWADTQVEGLDDPPEEAISDAYSRFLREFRPLKAVPEEREPDLDITGRQEMIDAINARAEPEGERHTERYRQMGEIISTALQSKVDAMNLGSVFRGALYKIRDLIPVLPTDTGDESNEK